MRFRGFLVALMATLAAALYTPYAGVIQAQGAAALGGVVSSQEEGKMEGVVVTARREGANFDVSVVSDAQGKYSFPRSHVAPGKYAVKIRAVGYDLTSPGAVDGTAASPASLDLTLGKTKDLTTQITSVEWLNNLPG